MHVELQTLKLTISMLLMGFKSMDFRRAIYVRGQVSALKLLLCPGASPAFVQVLNAAYRQIDARVSELSGEDLRATGTGG